MLAIDFRKHVKESKAVWGFIRWSPYGTGHWIKLAKSDALEMIKGEDSNTFVKATWDKDRKILNVGHN